MIYGFYIAQSAAATADAAKDAVPPILLPAAAAEGAAEALRRRHRWSADDHNDRPFCVAAPADHRPHTRRVYNNCPVIVPYTYIRSLDMHICMRREIYIYIFLYNVHRYI